MSSINSNRNRSSDQYQQQPVTPPLSPSEVAALADDESGPAPKVSPEIEAAVAASTFTGDVCIHQLLPRADLLVEYYVNSDRQYDITLYYYSYDQPRKVMNIHRYEAYTNVPMRMKRLLDRLVTPKRLHVTRINQKIAEDLARGSKGVIIYKRYSGPLLRKHLEMQQTFIQEPSKHARRRYAKKLKLATINPSAPKPSAPNTRSRVIVYDATKLNANGATSIVDVFAQNPLQALNKVARSGSVRWTDFGSA